MLHYIQYNAAAQHVSIPDGTWLSGFDSLVSITWLLVLVSILFIKGTRPTLLVGRMQSPQAIVLDPLKLSLGDRLLL